MSTLSLHLLRYHLALRFIQQKLCRQHVVQVELCGAVRHGFTGQADLGQGVVCSLVHGFQLDSSQLHLGSLKLNQGSNSLHLSILGLPEGLIPVDQERDSIAHRTFSEGDVRLGVLRTGDAAFLKFGLQVSTHRFHQSIKGTIAPNLTFGQFCHGDGGNRLVQGTVSSRRELILRTRQVNVWDREIIVSSEILDEFVCF